VALLLVKFGRGKRKEEKGEKMGRKMARANRMRHSFDKLQQLNSAVFIVFAFLFLVVMFAASSETAFAAVENVGTPNVAVIVDNPASNLNGKVAIQCEGCEAGSVQSEEENGIVAATNLVCHKERCEVCTADISPADDECSKYKDSERDNCITGRVSELCSGSDNSYVFDRYAISHATAEFYMGGKEKGKLKELTVLRDEGEAAPKAYTQSVFGENIELYPGDKILFSGEGSYEINVNSDVALKDEQGARKDRTLSVAGAEFEAIAKGTKITFEKSDNGTKLREYELFIKSNFPERWHSFPCGENKEVHLRDGASQVKCKVDGSRSELLCPDCNNMDLRIFSILSEGEGINPPHALKLFFPSYSGFSKAVMEGNELLIRSNRVSVGKDSENKKGQEVFVPEGKFKVEGNQIIVNSLKNMPAYFFSSPVYTDKRHGLFYDRIVLESPQAKEAYSLIVKTGAKGEMWRSPGIKTTGKNVMPIPFDTGRDDYIAEIWAMNRGPLNPEDHGKWERITNHDIALINGRLKSKVAFLDLMVRYSVEPIKEGGLSHKKYEIRESAVGIGETGKNCTKDSDCDAGEKCSEGKCFETERVETMCETDADCQPGESCEEGQCVCGADDLCDLDEQCIRGKCVPLTVWSLVRQECFNGLYYNEMDAKEKEMACNVYLDALGYNVYAISDGLKYGRERYVEGMSRADAKKKYCSEKHILNEENGLNPEFAIRGNREYAGVKLPGTTTFIPMGRINKGNFHYVRAGFCWRTAGKWNEKLHPARNLNVPGKNYRISRSDFKKLPNGNLAFTVKKGQSLTEIVSAYNSFFAPRRSVKSIAQFNNIKKHPVKDWYILHPGDNIEFPPISEDKLESFKKTIKEVKKVVESSLEDIELEKAVENSLKVDREMKSAGTVPSSDELPSVPLVGICNRENSQIWDFDKKACVEGCREDDTCKNGKTCYEGKCQIPELVPIPKQGKAKNWLSGKATITAEKFNVVCSYRGKDVNMEYSSRISLPAEVGYRLKDGKVDSSWMAISTEGKVPQLRYFVQGECQKRFPAGTPRSLIGIRAFEAEEMLVDFEDSNLGKVVLKNRNANFLL